MKNNKQVDSSCKVRCARFWQVAEFPAASYFHFMNSPTLLTLVIIIIKVEIFHNTYNEDRQFNE